MQVIFHSTTFFRFETFPYHLILFCVIKIKRITTTGHEVANVLELMSGHVFFFLFFKFQFDISASQSTTV